MADAILGADAPARKLTSSDIPHTRSVMVLEGLVAAPHLDLDRQIAATSWQCCPLTPAPVRRSWR